KDFTAEKLFAKPTAAAMPINSFAEGWPRSDKESFTSGCKLVSPPTTPRDKGTSSENLNVFSSISTLERGEYCPLLAAYACPQASTALKSFPLASTTASIPLKIPLL